jgi:hypothetical protein
MNTKLQDFVDDDDDDDDNVRDYACPNIILVVGSSNCFGDKKQYVSSDSKSSLLTSVECRLQLDADEPQQAILNTDTNIHIKQKHVVTTNASLVMRKDHPTANICKIKLSINCLS